MKTISITVCVVVMLISAAACRCLGGPGPVITAKVQEGGGFCSVVRVPRDWEAPIEYIVSLHGMYRKPAQGSGFLYSLENPYAKQPVAISPKYWVDLEHRGTIRLASDDEWNAATDVPFLASSIKGKVEGQAPTEHPIRRDNTTVSFNGRVLPKSGDIWLGSYASPGDRYAVLESFNGWWETGRAAYDGPFFIDVYEVSTGKRVALIHGSWCNYTPDGFLNEIKWISNRDIVFPFGGQKRDILVCHFN